MTKKIMIAMWLILATMTLSGCGSYRFVIDLVPAVDGLQETVVMEDSNRTWTTPKIALIDVSGIIRDEATGASPLSSGGASPVARFTEALNKAATDTKVKAIIVQMNSPGGTVTASDLMYRELKYFKKRTKKPVVVLMGALAASGGYYISVAGDELIANPTTLTGSIGVIMQTFNFSEGMSRIGIKADSITSGPNKAVGNPFEPMSDDHRAMLQGIVLEMYTSFKNVVIENRPQIDEAILDEITDGRVVTGVTAVELGVVDSLGDIRDAFKAAKKRAGLDRATLVKYHRPTEYVGGPYAKGPDAPGMAGQTTTQVNLLQLNFASDVMSRAQFHYLWDPMAW
ncbi:MAG: signal peptide peptidase SppA [Planctomycetota bacterium]|nr:signal peptide peptidase SppA [Planctomycetota bacterium]